MTSRLERFASLRLWPGTVVLAALAAALAAGCTASTSTWSERQQMEIGLVNALREEALKVPLPGQRERLVSGLTQLRLLMEEETALRPAELVSAAPVIPGAEAGAPAGPAAPAALAWATMFAPKNLVISYFTKSRDFDGQPGDDGLEVRLRPLDQFGDPTKAVGSYRIEVFAYRPLSGEKRGERLGHWFVSVLDAKSNRKYYDGVDRCYVFPLLWDHEIKAGTDVIVQATYYPPGGSQDKLFAQRVIRIGAGEE